MVQRCDGGGGRGAEGQAEASACHGVVARERSAVRFPGFSKIGNYAPCVQSTSTAMEAAMSAAPAPAVADRCAAPRLARLRPRAREQRLPPIERPCAPSAIVAAASSLVGGLIGEAPSCVWPAEAPAADMPAADMPAADMPAADMPAADMPAADMPAADMPAADMPAADMPAAG